MIGSNNEITTTERVIAEVYDEFNIQQDDWAPRAKRWANAVVNRLKINTVITYKEVDINDYSFILPCDLKYLIYLEIDGVIILPSKSRATLVKSDTELGTKDKYTFLHKGNNVIYTSVETGKVIVYYKELSKDCNNYCFIPDDERVKDAIKYGIIRILLLRGYKHPTLTFDKVEHSFINYYLPSAMNAARPFTFTDALKVIENNNILVFQLGSTDYMYNNIYK